MSFLERSKWLPEWKTLSLKEFNVPFKGVDLIDYADTAKICVDNANLNRLHYIPNKS